MPTIQITVHGQVQGVYFRATAMQVADALHITGWVRNLPNGSVQAVATGSDEQLRQFIDWCRKGPAAAVVVSVATETLPDEHFRTFDIRRG